MRLRKNRLSVRVRQALVGGFAAGAATFAIAAQDAAPAPTEASRIVVPKLAYCDSNPISGTAKSAARKMEFMLSAVARAVRPLARQLSTEPARIWGAPSTRSTRWPRA